MLLIFMCLLTSTFSPLQEYQWKNRIILLAGEQEFVDAQKLKYLEHPEALKERGLVIITVIDDKAEFYPAPAKINLDVQELKAYFQLTLPFSSLLIGKDGSIKARHNEIIEASQYFDKIDMMPMRIQEMRNKAKSRMQ